VQRVFSLGRADVALGILAVAAVGVPVMMLAPEVYLGCALSRKSSLKSRPKTCRRSNRSSSSAAASITFAKIRPPSSALPATSSVWFAPPRWSFNFLVAERTARRGRPTSSRSCGRGW